MSCKKGFYRTLTQFLQNVAYSLYRIGRIEQAEGNLERARTLFAEGLEISRKLAEQLNTPDSLRGVSVFLDSIGDLEQEDGNLDNARILYVESLEITRKLAEKLNTPKFLRDVACTLESIGTIEQAEGNFECARTLYAESFEIFRKLAEQQNTPSFTYGKIWTLQQLAHVQILLEEYQAAFNLLKEIESDVDRLLGECNGNSNSLDTLAVYWERRTEVEEKLKMPEAKTSKAKAEAIRNEIDS